jgi:hypothetical protein
MNGNSTADELFPALAHNRTGVILRGYRSREDLKQKQLSEMTGIRSVTE